MTESKTSTSSLLYPCDISKELSWWYWKWRQYNLSYCIVQHIVSVHVQRNIMAIQTSEASKLFTLPCSESEASCITCHFTDLQSDATLLFKEPSVAIGNFLTASVIQATITSTFAELVSKIYGSQPDLQLWLCNYWLNTTYLGGKGVISQSCRYVRQGQTDAGGTSLEDFKDQRHDLLSFALCFLLPSAFCPNHLPPGSLRLACLLKWSRIFFLAPSLMALVSGCFASPGLFLALGFFLR